MNLLLLSNSTLPGEGLLEWAEPCIREFTANIKGRVAFIPYAAVTVSYEEYYIRVRDRFREWGIEVESVHHFKSPAGLIEKSEFIITGGGNTFHLLHELQEHKLLQLIRERVLHTASYLGWSAGANLACPGIMTTNDMPIIETQGLEALNLLPFQLNPHFTEKRIEGHGGESREDRIKEFLEIHKEKKVIGLREGSGLLLQDGKLTLKGKSTALIFERAKEAIEVKSSSDLTYLLV